MTEKNTKPVSAPTAGRRSDGSETPKTSSNLKRLLKQATEEFGAARITITSRTDLRANIHLDYRLEVKHPLDGQWRHCADLDEALDYAYEPVIVTVSQGRDWDRLEARLEEEDIPA